MSTVITEFDAVSIKNMSIQFKSGGTQQPGEKFGCVGSISGETESKEIVKKCEGVEAKKITIPQKMNLTVSAHVPVKVIRSIFGIKNEGLKAGVYSYGADSIGDAFVLTGDVIDDFEDVTKLIAFANAVNTGGYSFSIENGQEEIAELEFSFTALVDENNKLYYEAFVSELTDETIADTWHTNFTADLVTTPAP